MNARLLLAVVVGTLPACAKDFVLSSPLIEGKVIEQETQKPVPDALIVVLWKGHVGWTGTVCYHVETTTTDKRGIYRIGAWAKPSPYGDIKSRYHQPVAYKPDYEDADSDKDTIRLKPFAGSRGHRLKCLERIEYATRCSSANESERNLLPFYRALHEEAKSLAVTTDERRIVDGFLSNIEMIEFGYEVAMKRAVERAEKRKQQQ